MKYHVTIIDYGDGKVEAVGQEGVAVFTEHGGTVSAVLTKLLARRSGLDEKTPTLPTIPGRYEISGYYKYCTPIKEISEIVEILYHDNRLCYLFRRMQDPCELIYWPKSFVITHVEKLPSDLNKIFR